jgi:hypothetical protein
LITTHLARIAIPQCVAPAFVLVPITGNLDAQRRMSEGAVADFAPQIFTSDAKGAGPQTSPTTWLPSAISGGKPALELNLETIEIHEVRSVDVTTDPHKVFQHR